MLKSLTVLLSLFISASVAAAPASTADFYSVSQKDLVYVDTQYGTVVIWLTDKIAPTHAQRFRDLVKSGYYNGKNFYRVVDGFVAQGGANVEEQDIPLAEPMKAEFTAKNVEGFYEIQRPAPFAPVTGFIDGMPAATTPSRDSYWFAHCPGTLAMARDNNPDTGSTEFYIVIGQAPRHLDRNMSVFGRVLSGMEVLQQLPRGKKENSGVIENLTDKSAITAMKLGTQLPAGAQRHFLIQLPGHPDFQKKLEAARQLANPFFADKTLAPRPIDVCYYQPEIKEVTQ